MPTPSTPVAPVTPATVPGPAGDGGGFEGSDYQSRALIGALQDGILVIGPDLRVVEASARLCEMTGYPEHEWLGSTAPFPIWPQEDAARLASRLDEAVASGGGRYEVHFERRNGERFPAVVDICPVEMRGRNGTGTGMGTVCVVRDATDEMRERRELLESRERLREAHEVARLSSWEWDPVTDTFTVSSGLSDAAGVDVSAPLPRSRVLKLLAPRDRERLGVELRTLLDRGGDLRTRHALRVPGSSIAYVETRARACRDAGGRLVVRGTTQDVSDQRRAEREAARARGLLEGTLASLSAQIAVLGRDGDVVATNLAWERSAGEAGATAAVGESYLAQWAGADARAAAVGAGLREVLAGRRDCFEFEYDSPGPHWYLVRVTRYRGVGATRVVVQRDDVTAQRTAQEASRLQARLLDEVDAAVIATDLEGYVTYWNDGAEQLYGWTREETNGRFVMEFISPQDPETAAAVVTAASSHRRWDGEYNVTRKDGSTVPSDHRLSPIENEHGAPIGVIGVSVDISERVRAAAELRLARDHLRAVTDSMGEGLYTVDDVGRLTYMNSAAEGLLGWTASELLGQQMHDVIHHCRPDGSGFPANECPVLDTRTEGTAVHVEDDHFICRDGTYMPVAYTSAPFEADTGFRGAVVVFGDASARRAQAAKLERDVEALSWIGRIRDALEGDRFVLHAQPIIDVTSGETVQHELLIRMLDETGALVPPGLFLPVAEEYGLIREIDRWVIRQAAQVIADGHPVEINLSAESLGDPSLLAFVEQELARTGAEPADLVFELTETGLLRNEDSAQSFIEGVTRLGSHVALDDFGTGYGGFTYVKRLPVDFLKIDVEFVRDLAQNPASQHVVRAVVNLARDFGHRTIAEGVEDQKTLELLRALGVDFAQGFGIGRPAPLDQVLRSA